MKQRIPLIAYVLGVDVLAVAMTVSLPIDGAAQRIVTLLVVLGLATIVGARAVHIPHLRIHLTASDAFLFFGLLAVGPMAAPLAALAGTLGATVGGRPRPGGLRAAFNLGAVPLSAAAAAWVYLALAGSERSNPVAAALPLCAAAACFLIVNLTLVVLVMVLAGRARVRDVLRSSGACSLNSAFCSMLVGAGLAMLVESTGPAGILLALPATFAILDGFHRLNQRMAREERAVRTTPPLARRLSRFFVPLPRSRTATGIHPRRRT